MIYDSIAFNASVKYVEFLDNIIRKALDKHAPELDLPAINARCSIQKVAAQIEHYLLFLDGRLIAEIYPPTWKHTGDTITLELKYRIV